MAFKLQHWLVAIEYLAGKDNTFADALSREECTRRKKSVTLGIPDLCLDRGDVSVQPLQDKEEGVEAATPTE